MEIQNFVIEFDYNVESLNEIKSKMLSIDENDLAQVKEAIKQAVKIRRAIETKGKSYRDESNAFNKNVLAKEKEYVGIILPVEERLKTIVEEFEARQIREARIALLPQKKDQLSLLKVAQPSDEELLAMDDAQWVEFYNLKFTEHKQILENEEKEKQRKIDEDKRVKEAEEKARKDAETKAENDKQEALRKAEKEKQDIIDENNRKEKARVEEEERKKREEAEEKEKLEKAEKYQAWLKDNGWTEEKKEEFAILRTGNVVKLAKIISTYSIE